MLVFFFASPIGQSILDMAGQYSNIISDNINNPIIKEIMHIFFDITLNHWPSF